MYVFDINKLRDKKIRRDFCLELKNKYAALGNIGYTIEEHWNIFRDTYTDTSKTVLGFKNNKQKE